MRPGGGRRVRRAGRRAAPDARHQGSDRDCVPHELPALVHDFARHHQRNLLPARRSTQHARPPVPHHRQRNFLSRGTTRSRTRDRLSGEGNAALPAHEFRSRRPLSHHQGNRHRPAFLRTAHARADRDRARLARGWQDRPTTANDNRLELRIAEQFGFAALRSTLPS
jgi:hypothetical protein